MNVPALLLAITGLALGMRAVLRTEIEDIRERASLGGLSIALLATGIAFV